MLFEGIGDKKLTGSTELSAVELAAYLGRTNILGRFISLGGVMATRATTDKTKNREYIKNYKKLNDERGKDLYEGISYTNLLKLTLKGLNVGGKKMDWVEEFRDAKKPITAYTTLLHLAAASQQTHTIKYLMNEGRKIWEQSPQYNHNMYVKL